MAKNLVIVESPAKAKTIEKYLGKDFKVTSSMGHVRDLSKGDKAIDIDVCLWDERLSTVGAFNLSSQLDVNVSKREKNIDQNAAAFILQGAIEFLNN